MLESLDIHMNPFSQPSFKIYVSQSVGLWVWHILATHGHTMTVVRSAPSAFGSRAEAATDAELALRALASVAKIAK